MSNILKESMKNNIIKLNEFGWSERRISRKLRVHRKTVKKYILENSKCTNPTAGDSEGNESECTISTAGNSGRKSTCEPHDAFIRENLLDGLSAQRIYQDLCISRGFEGSYEAVKRYARKLKKRAEIPFRRMKKLPGEECQVDYGTGAWVRDVNGKRHKTHVLRVTLSYSHLCHCDARDLTLKKRMARRTRQFSEPTEETASFVRTVRKIMPDFVANTGDFLDRPTAANIDACRDVVDRLGVPFYFAIGNHEWASPAERIKRAEWNGRFAALTKQNLDWYVKEMCGVNLLFIDDSDYQISAKQLVRTRELLDTGRPCIMFMHIPIAVESLLPATIAKWKKPIVLGGKGMKAKASTLEFCEMVKSRAEVKAIFAGHLHFDHVDELGGGGRQYVTGPGYQGRYRFVRVRGT